MTKNPQKPVVHRFAWMEGAVLQWPPFEKACVVSILLSTICILATLDNPDLYDPCGPTWSGWTVLDAVCTVILAVEVVVRALSLGVWRGPHAILRSGLITMDCTVSSGGEPTHTQTLTRTCRQLNHTRRRSPARAGNSTTHADAHPHVQALAPTSMRRPVPHAHTLNACSCA